MATPQQPSPRTLVLVRHAKAEAGAPSDAERRLTESGRTDAAALGAWLRGTVGQVDRALVSAATRTRETWALLAGEAGWDVAPQVEQSLYAAAEDAVLDLVGTVDDAVGTLLVLGHNPTTGSLVQLLDDGEGASATSTQTLVGFPTSAAAVFSYDGPWSGLAPGSATLRAYHPGSAGSA